LSDLLRIFIENIFPVIFVAGAGYLLQRLFDLDPRPLAIVVFYALTPCLIFTLLTSSQIDGSEMLRMVGFASLVIISLLLISFLAGSLLRLDRESKSSFILASTFMNAGNYGLSVTQFALGNLGLAWASIYYITISLWTNSAGVIVANTGRLPMKEAWLRLFKVPAVYAAASAAVIVAADWTVPLGISRPIELLSQATVPMMILVAGMQIGRAGLPKRIGLLVLAVGIQLVIAPAAAWILTSLIGLQGVSATVGIIESAMPAAVLTSIIAMEFDTQPRFVTGVVLVSTLLSPFTLTPLLAILGV
jgi:predicted permease